MATPSWKLLAHVAYDPSAPGQRQYLPSRDDRSCRFCCGNAPSLKFRKDAHAIPEALGNRFLLSLEECDSCNARGSELEDDLAKHLTVARVMARIRGKEGDVKHRFGNRPSFVMSDAANNQIIMDRTEGDDSVSRTRIAGGVRWRIKVPGYRPLNVAKALARIVLMLVPEPELAGLDHIRKWIRGEVEWSGVSFDEGFIPGPGLVKVQVAVEKQIAPTADEAHFRLALLYGTATFSFHLPGPDMSLVAAPMPPAARSPYPPYDVKWRRIRPRTGVFRGRVDEVDFFVPALAATPLPSHEEIAVAAYYRWTKRGSPSSPEGATRDWLDAEQDLLWQQVECEVLSVGEVADPRGGATATVQKLSP